MERYSLISLFLASTLICTWTSPISNSTTTSLLLQEKLRQDGDGDVDVEAPIEGLQLVAGPISQIISGTLSGNIGQLFNGITGTITDQEAQPGVGQILTGVSIPLSTLWSSGIAAGQKYFNISTQGPLKASVPTSTPLPVTGGAAGVKVAAVTQAPVEVVTEATEAQVVITTPAVAEDDDEEEGDNNDKLRI